MPMGTAHPLPDWPCGCSEGVDGKGRRLFLPALGCKRWLVNHHPHHSSPLAIRRAPPDSKLQVAAIARSSCVHGHPAMTTVLLTV